VTRFLALLCLLIPIIGVADRYDDAVNNPSRVETDRVRDGLRQPASVLRTVGVHEGLTVLDVGAGGGYYSEMFAYLVGESGEVILQNPSQLYEIFPKLHSGLTDQRLADGRLANARLIENETTALGLDDASIDLVFFHLIYHDMFWLHTDQIDAINAEIRRVLKPGGRVVIIDHDSIDGARNSQTLSRQDALHRLEDAYLEEIMTEAGFALSASSDTLRVAEDDHSQPFFAEELRGKPTDRFFHIYIKQTGL
jgi:predicted methyltransferase